MYPYSLLLGVAIIFFIIIVAKFFDLKIIIKSFVLICLSLCMGCTATTNPLPKQEMIVQDEDLILP
jgi:hypothetical protein